MKTEYSLYPGFAHAIHTVAQCYHSRREDYATAISLLQLALESAVDPAARIAAYKGMAQCLAKQGNDQEASEIVAAMLSEDVTQEGLPRAIFLVAEQYTRSGLENTNPEQARADFEKSIAIIEHDVLGIVESDPNGQISPDIEIVELPTMSKNVESDAWYLLALNYWYLGRWFPAADGFLRSIEANPNHQFAGSMYWLVSDCYEKLKRDGVVSAEEADPLIEWGYQTLFDRYPDSRDVEYAAIQLGKIHLARGEPVSACTYFNWFLDHTHAENGQIADIGRIMETMEGCSR